MKTIKLILLIENIICIHRNYSWLGKSQPLIFFRILFEISLSAAALIFHQICFIILNVEMLYFCVSYLNSIFVICLSAYHSKAFKKLMDELDHFKSYFPNNVIYERDLMSQKKPIYYVTVLYNMFVLISYTSFYLTIPTSDVFSSMCPVFTYYLADGSLYLSDYRLLIEVTIICSFYLTMSDQLNCITRSIDMEIENIKMYKLEHGIDNYYGYCKSGLKFDKWSAAYTIVENISKLSRQIFGLQITEVVAIMFFSYIMLLNGIAMLSVTGKFTPLMQFMYLFILLEFVVALWMLSRAAQRTNNSAVALRQRLGKLLVQSLGCDKQYKATRDFLRLVSARPIQTKAFGSIDVDMTLLPTCIAFCASYTVIALQFNNIL